MYGPNMRARSSRSRKPHLRVDFDRRLKLEFHGNKITSDAGLLAYRELDDVLGLTDLGGAALSDLRRGKNTRHLLTGLLRQSVFGRLAGYEDVNDAERLSRDPAMRARSRGPWALSGIDQPDGALRDGVACHSFRNNEVRLQLHALAYNLGNFLRTLALPQEVEHWSG